MSTASSTSWKTDTSAPSAAAVAYGIALIGVLRSCTQRIFGIGRTAKAIMAQVRSEGVDPLSENAGLDFREMLSLLRRALRMADALRARLWTPAVAVAMLRPKSAASGSRGGTSRAGAKDDDNDPLVLISHRRTDAAIRLSYRQTIANMSDFTIVVQIIKDLLQVSQKLGDNDSQSRIALVMQRLVKVLAKDLEEGPLPGDAPFGGAASGEAAKPGHAGAAAAETGVQAVEMPGAQPSPREVGRGPP